MAKAGLLPCARLAPLELAAAIRDPLAWPKAVDTKCGRSASGHHRNSKGGRGLAQTSFYPVQHHRWLLFIGVGRSLWFNETDCFSWVNTHTEM